MASETALCQVMLDGKWTDFARTHEPDAVQWARMSPDRRRVVDWISRKVIFPPPWIEEDEEAESEAEADRIAARVNFMFAGARALHELEWAHDMNVCPVCQQGRG